MHLSLSKLSWLPLLVAAGIAWAGEAVAESQVARRVAVVAGNNIGAARDVPLRFAQRDATRMARTLRELGRFTGEDLELLLDRDADSLRRALQRAAERLRAQAGRGILLFYFSGHAAADGLHLGSTLLSWSELRRLLSDEQAELRIALVDACQAGLLIRAKGFALAPPLEPEQPSVRGLAVMVAADAQQSAQEVLNLEGSYFTHFLISGLRGAADLDGDRRVTLAEAQAYTSQQTRKATSAWARSIQRPVYHFDIRGHDQLVLTDLRDAAARLVVAADLAGYLVVVERDTGRVMVEAEKVGGRGLELALPAGRYQVHLRRTDAIFVNEVDLPWGGRSELGEADLVPHSYQEVARKGVLVEIHRQRLRLGAGVQTAVLPGIGPLPLAHLEYGFKLSPVELGLRLRYSRDTTATVDTRVTSDYMDLGINLAYEYPIGIVDLRGYLIVDAVYVGQLVERQGWRWAVLPGVGLGAGVRVPILWRLFFEAFLEGMVHFPRLDGHSRSSRLSAVGGLDLGIVF